jgi:hypothetical protein
MKGENFVNLKRRDKVRTKDVWGVEILNVTPHSITFGREDNDEVIIVVPSKILLNARVSEKKVLRPRHLRNAGTPIICVQPHYLSTIEGHNILQEVPNGVVVVGSIIAAQAYPSTVFAMTPCKGYERVPIAEKRMRHDKFIVFY